MTAEIKWYKREPDAALAGMFELSLEERGAYNTVLDLIYSKANNLVDDDRWIAGWMRCDVRVWKRIKSRLIETKKLCIRDGFIHNPRADVEIDEALSRAVSLRELNRSKGLKSGAVRRKNNGLAEPPVEPPTNTTTTTIVDTTDKHQSGYCARATPPPEPEPVEPEIAPVVKIGKAITDLMGVSEDPRWLGNWSTVQQWLNEGFGEKQILQSASAVIQRLKASGRRMPGTLNYFTRAIREDWHVKPSVPTNGEFKEVSRGSEAFKAWIADRKKKGLQTAWLEKQDTITIPVSFGAQ